MSKKKKLFLAGGIVYSTDPGFLRQADNNAEENTLQPSDQKLRIRLDTKNRSGKAVTLVEGFSGSEEDREALGKKLKTFCGTGGSVKEGAIIIQGDNRDKVFRYFQQNGYTSAKKL